jgi:hypothetical protein
LLSGTSAQKNNVPKHPLKKIAVPAIATNTTAGASVMRQQVFQ